MRKYSPKEERTEIEEVIDLSVLLKPKGDGYLLTASSNTFEFSPEEVLVGGYADVLVDGNYVGRMYSSYYFFDLLPSESSVVEVVLNSNKDEAYTFEGDLVSATTTVTLE
jgi:hypothetical protein